MTTLPPIGLSGFARSGKTTAAEYLEDKYGYTRLHIAEPLRAMLDTLLDEGFGMYEIERWKRLEGPLKEEVIPCLGVTSRHAQVSLGTAWGREEIHPDLWVNAWKYRASKFEGPMNDSVRFPNEEQCIREMSGFTILIVRPGTTPAAYKWGRFGKWLFDTFGVMRGVHDSERVDRLNPTYTIINNGTVEQLYRAIDVVMLDTTLPRQPLVVRADSL